MAPPPRTLKECETLEEAREVIGAFIGRYNNGWLLQRHGYMAPARAREKLSRKAALTCFDLGQQCLAKRLQAADDRLHMADLAPIDPYRIGEPL